MTRKTLATIALAAAAASSAFVIAGCSSASTPDSTSTDDGTLQVVASTNVYGDLASTVGGDLVEVTSIIASISQDPHEYESTAQDQLAISQADLVIDNGGGYDPFLDALLESSGSDAVVLTAAELSPDWPGEDDHDHSDDAEATEEADEDGHDHIEGFNEHVWYDPHTMSELVTEIGHELGELDEANAETYEKNAAALAAQIEGLETGLADLKAAHEGEKIFVTEPVPLYLTGAAGLVNATPEAFSEAVEEGQDVPPATLLEATGILAAGDIRTVIVNAQTGGAETTEVVKVAGEQGIPVLEFTELIPDGETYVSWMQQNIDELAGTLTR
ncbi:metal ABC transporter solute-binding protein, Zn/Mn family [Microbacterium sp.]|uniref:metal ABC transporter solute-binding protein, Zn/Mn family n=1 Tax=Microbacterium sp. TaxID=51671 RepID=UPI0039E4CEFB